MGSKRTTVVRIIVAVGCIALVAFAMHLIWPGDTTYWKRFLILLFAGIVTFALDTYWGIRIKAGRQDT